MFVVKKESWKIMFACAVGAFIGSLIALELKPWLIWVGLIAGGLVGYLAYDFRRVLSVIPAAYRAARGWIPGRNFWLDLLLCSLVALEISFFLTVLCVIIPLAGYYITTDGFPTRLFIRCLPVSISSFVSALLYFMFRAWFLDECIGLNEAKDLRRAIPRIAFDLAPPIIFFYHLPRGIWWMAKRMPKATLAIVRFVGSTGMALVRFFGRFGWQVFIRIHSERRVLCLTDSVIGSVIGYLAGSAIVGALAGGLVGLVNYELVTRRWLVPRGYVKAAAR